ncbi:MAG: hypothetical protein AMXMBFR67_07960 [Nitrospira sp.]
MKYFISVFPARVGMNRTRIKVWFDPEGDYLEVQFRDVPGFMRATAHDAVMERVDDQGHVLGFSILGVSRFKKDHPL